MWTDKQRTLKHWNFSGVEAEKVWLGNGSSRYFWREKLGLEFYNAIRAEG